jgi:hypothetical protein
MTSEPEEGLPEIRVSDAERQAVVEVLRAASADGRISLAEFDDRSRAAYGATTRADLDSLTADLPRPSPGASLASAPVAATSAPPPDGGVSWTVAVMSGNERKGRWRVSRRTTAVAVMGGCKLDLREATVPPDEVQITAVAVMGGVEVVVAEGVEVVISGFSLMGGYDAHVADVPRRPGTPIVRVRAISIMGGVEVKSKPPSDGARTDKRLDRA